MNYFDVLLAKKLEDDRDPKVEGLSVSANGRYHEDGVVYDPVIVNVPETPLSKLTVTENGTYTAPSGTAYNEVEVDVPLPENAYLLKDIPNTPTAIATFTDGADLPMPKLEVGIEAVQDLHGYDAPWVGGSGKNKWGYGVSTTPDVSGSYGGWYISYNTNATLKLFDKGTTVDLTNVYLGLSESGTSTPVTWVINNGVVQSSGIISSTDYHYVSIYPNNTQTLEKIFAKFNVMCVIDNADSTTFAPYSNICPISGWSEANVSVCGINYFDKTTVQNGYVNDATGAVSTGAGAKCTDFIKIMPNTSYYVKSEQTSGMWGAYYDKNKNYVSGVTAYPNSVITTPNNACYVRLTVLYNNSGNIDTFALNYPSTDTSYHAYNGQTYTIDLDGTRYGGKVDLVSGVMTVDRMYKDLGDYNWTADVGITGLVRTQDNTIKYMGNIISSHYKGVKNLPLENMPDGSMQATNVQAYLLLRVRDERLDGKTSTEIKTMLTGIQMVAELATPLTIQLPTTVVKSLRGVNNISADSGDILDLSYLAKEE